MRPDDIFFAPAELALVWPDGHQSFYPLEALRKSCPCALCRGETVLLKRAPPQPQSYQAESFEVADWTPVGNYALQVFWGDGHQTGIYRWDWLRQNCPCAECSEPR